MDLNVKFDENLYLNPVSGETKTQARSSIPLMTPISVRKMKPSLKYAKKIGDVWLGANKMSFNLLLTYILLKQEKNKVIGFFKHGDRYLYIEGSVDLHKQTFIITGFTAANETPDLFVSVSGKVYDAVFGPTDIKTADFDFVRAYRELSRRISPAHVVVVVLCLAMSGYLLSIVLEKPPKIEPPKMLQKAPPPPPPLTPAEMNKLLLMLKDKFIEKYSEEQDGIRKKGYEKWLKSVTVTTVPVPDSQAMSINVHFTYSSYYPFEGAKKEGKNYIWTSLYGQTLGRQDLDRFPLSKVGPYVCLKYLINYDVTERSKTQWVVLLKEDKYPRIAFLLNLIYDCPCIVKDMTIDEKGLSGTVLLDIT